MLVAVTELEGQLKEGWSRKAKSKETTSPEADVIDLMDDT